MNPLIRPSVQMSCKRNYSLTDEFIKLDTVAVCNLRMCMKEDNQNLNYFKGDNSREVIQGR